MKQLLFVLAVLVGLSVSGQVYNPSIHTTTNKSLGVAQAAPTDARTMFYDEDNFVYRAYVDTSEVNDYLTLAKYRTGGFDVLVNTGGTLGVNGVITGGTNAVWYYRDGTDDDDLIPKVTPAASYTATNGITLASSAFKLGGTGTENTTNTWGAFSWTNTFNGLTGNGFTISSTATAVTTGSKLLNVTATGILTGSLSETYAIYGSNLRTGTVFSTTGVYGEGGTYGLFGISSAGNGVRGESTSSTGGIFQSVSGRGIWAISASNIAVQANSTTSFAIKAEVESLPLTSAVNNHSWFTAQASGTPANGFGSRFLFGGETSSTSYADAMAIDWWWSNATHGSRTAAFGISLVNNAGSLTRRFQVAGTGQVTHSAYGAGTFTGTATKWAAWDASGNLIEENAPSAFSNPMNAIGDIIVGTTAGALAKLAIGTTGQIPQVVGGTLAYGTGAAWNGVFGTSTTTASASVTMSEANTIAAYTGAVPSTWTLPALGSSTKTMWVKNNGTADITVQRAGSDEIWTSTNVTSITVAPGESRGFVPLGGYWTSYFDFSSISDAGNITSGTLDDARLSSNVALLDGTNTWSATNTFAGITATSLAVGTVSNTEFSYLDGVSSALQGQIDGKVPTTRTVAIFGAATVTQDLSANRTYYPKTTFQQAIEAMGSVIKGQTVGVNFDQMSGVSFSAVDGTIYWQALWLPSPETLTGVKYWLGTQGNFTADNFNGFALYTYSGGTLTQVATSANDENYWKGTGGTYQTVPFTGTYSASAGLYFVAFLYNSSAQVTAPTFGIGQSVQSGGMQSGDLTNNAKLMSTSTGQTSLAASKAMSLLTVSTLRPWVAVY